MLDAADFLWNNRLILIFTPEEEAPAPVKLLAGEEAHLAERQILWFVVSGETVASNYAGPIDGGAAARLRARFQTAPEMETEVVLVGKDGGVKHRAGSLDTVDLYGRIDQMPMRQAEIRAKDEGR